MSVLQIPETMDSSADLQVWNNAAFDEISEDLTASRQSWGSLKSIFGNPNASFDSIEDKENQCVVLENNNNNNNNNNRIPAASSSLKSSSTLLKPLNAKNSSIEGVLKKNFDENVCLRKIRDEKKIDDEIEEIESEIIRLNSRLEALRREKAEMSVKIAEKRGRFVPAKFKDPIQSAKNPKDKKLIEEVSSMSARTKVQRRGISLGPVEIISGARRGTSVGPLEIFGATKSRQGLGKQELTTPIQSRRKSCFWKLQGINEEKVKSSSVSPKSRKVGPKAQVTSRQAVTTISSRKALKKDDSAVNSVQPKKLFKEGENPGPASSKKALRPGRVVASRYNQNTAQSSAMRKRSLPENDNDFNQKPDNKRASSVGKSRVNNATGSSSRVKKHWEIPSEIIVHGSVEGEKSTPQSIVLLPRIKIARSTKESPRDSGPAKKVVEMIGRKSFFANDEEDVEPSVRQELTYAEGGEECSEY